MHTKQIGKRLKEARLSRKMTQAEVVGDFITRNMLSQIESGTASPSLKTLEYLASVLDIPLEWLLRDGDQEDALAPADASTEASASAEADTFIDAKRAYRAGELGRAAGLLEPLCRAGAPFEDEACQLMAHVCLRMAEACRPTSKTEELTLLHQASHYAARGIYAGTGAATEAALLIRELLADGGQP